MGDRTWEQVGRLRKWLDDEAAQVEPADVRLLRVLEIGEEFGEVAEALHGALGANPRKGRSHDWPDVQKELVESPMSPVPCWAASGRRSATQRTFGARRGRGKCRGARRGVSVCPDVG